MARRDGAGVRLLTRRGLDWTGRYPSIAAAVTTLSCRSCLIDGEVVICGDDGVPVFDRLGYGRHLASASRLSAARLRWYAHAPALLRCRPTDRYAMRACPRQ